MPGNPDYYKVYHRNRSINRDAIYNKMTTANTTVWYTGSC